jgi:demethylmenaquinone methyltransferase/2-methoxy-6-polyprenyl-1,4-benzoquinol methylase
MTVDLTPATPSEDVALGSGAMFDAIAARYDRLNRILSLGLDRRWRRKTVEAMTLEPGARVLDLATGTADLALAITDAHPDAKVVGSDPSENMLAVGDRKVAEAGLGQRIHLELGDAQALEHPDDRFDACCMAFGIRNVPDRAKALREMARVVRSGGRVAILELAEPERGLLAYGARFYIRVVVPWVGSLLSGAQEYRYLQRSIQAFPPPQRFAGLMRSAGLDVLDVRPLTFGVVTLYVARVP